MSDLRFACSHLQANFYLHVGGSATNFHLNSYLVAVFLNCAVLYLPVGDYEKKLVWTAHANCGRGERGWHGRWVCANKLIKQDFSDFSMINDTYILVEELGREREKRGRSVTERENGEDLD